MIFLGNVPAMFLGNVLAILLSSGPVYIYIDRYQILLNVEIIRLSAEAVQNIIPPMTSIRHLKRRTPYDVDVTPKMSHSL